MKRLLFVAALLVSAFSSSGGQSLGQLPRATVATGMNDSTLIYVSDSAKRSRAAVAPDFRKMLSLRAFDSLMTTNLRLTGGAITGSPTATFGAITVSSCTGCAPTVVDSATGAARAQILTTARTIGGTSFNGSANIVPGLADSSTGSTRAQKLTTARTINGTSFDGTGNVTVSAAAGTLTGATLASGVTASSLTSFGVGALADSSTGSARAQKLTTARNFWGVSFDGTANVTTAPTFGAGATVSNGQTLALGTSTISGTPTWSSAQTFASGQKVDSATGAARSQTLTTARTINGTSFDGSANITVASAAGTLTGATLAAGVTASSLTSFGANARTDSSTGAARASALVGSPAITVSSCTGCGGTPQDSIRLKNGAAATPSLMFANSLTSGLYRFGADTIGFSTAGVSSMGLRGGATPTLFGGAGDFIFQSGIGNSRRLAVKTTTSAGTATTAVRFNELQQTLIADGTVGGAPGIAFASDTMMGMWRDGSTSFSWAIGGTRRLLISSSAPQFTVNGSAQVASGTVASPSLAMFNSNDGINHVPAGDTMYFVHSGVKGVQFTGGAASTIIGGAGNTTLLAGTGNSRQLALQTTTSGGTATTALRFNEAQQSLFTFGSATRPGIAFAGDSITGFAHNGTGTIDVVSVGTASWRFANGGVFQPPSDNTGSIGSAAQSFATIFASTQFSGPAGTTNTPTYGFNGVSGQGFYRFGSDTLGFSTGNAVTFKISGGAAARLTGGAGNTTILAGTGNNRSLNFQSSNSSGAATTFASGSGDTLKITAHAIAAGLTAASGTPHAACFDPTTHELEDNAALTCTVSSIRFKKDVEPLSLDSAQAIVDRLTAVTFIMRADGRPSLHVIAEQADSISKRLSFYDSFGRVNSVDDGAILSAALRVVQDQKAQLKAQSMAIDSLRSTVKFLSCMSQIRESGKAGMCVQKP